MSNLIRTASLFILLVLLAAAGTIAWTFASALAEEKARGDLIEQRAAALEKYVTQLKEDHKRLQARLEKYTAAEKSGKELENRKKIETQVEEIRELPFLEQVQFSLIERSRLSEILQGKISEQFTDQDLGNMSQSLAAMGLIPGGMDLKKTLVDLLAEQVGAFYDQHAHKLFMFTGSTLENHQDRIILAHELTHALQDQHFKLSKFPLEVKDNDDLVLATSALVEGDATLLMSKFLINNFSLGTLRDSLKGMLSQDMKKLAQVPLYLRETLLFPYLRGQEFCGELYAMGGWPRLSEAFLDPPKSTAQILHPEKYIGIPREDPIPVQFESTSALGTEPIGNNVMGELGIRILFTDLLSAKEGEQAGEGWRGDRYLVYVSGKDYNVVWKSLWSSARDAEEFRVSNLRYLCKRYQLPKEVKDNIPSDVPFTYDGARFIRLIRQGNSVLAIDASTKEWAEALMQVGD